MTTKPASDVTVGDRVRLPGNRVGPVVRIEQHDRFHGIAGGWLALIVNAPAEFVSAPTNVLWVRPGEDVELHVEEDIA